MMEWNSKEWRNQFSEAMKVLARAGQTASQAGFRAYQACSHGRRRHIPQRQAHTWLCLQQRPWWKGTRFILHRPLRRTSCGMRLSHGV